MGDQGMVDDYGNYWPMIRSVRSEISSDDFSREYNSYGTILVNIYTDEIYVAGNDRQSLVTGLISKGLNPTDFQFERGPFSLISE